MSKYLLIFIIPLSTFFSCESETTNSECNDCGGGLLNGFLYKEVTLEDVGNLMEINLSANVGQCIRFKMDGIEFSEAEIVDDCCCTIYQ